MVGTLLIFSPEPLLSFILTTGGAYSEQKKQKYGAFAYRTFGALGGYTEGTAKSISQFGWAVPQNVEKGLHKLVELEFAIDGDAIKWGELRVPKAGGNLWTTGTKFCFKKSRYLN